MTPRPRTRTLLATAALCALSFAVTPARPGDGDGAQSGRSLDETRLTMDKWIETQQIISKEKKEWQQGREILAGRVELVKNEMASLTGKIAEAQASVDDANRKRDELLAENERLKTVQARLTDAVAAMEVDVKRLCQSLPEPVQQRVQQLRQRLADAGAKKVSVAERFQNVLGILNEVNKANSEITVNYEVHPLADGRPAEVQAVYVGLAQAWFVSGSGEAGIGRPTPDGWTWENSKEIARDVMTALEIVQGKQSPAFVPLPVKLK
jgi:hypothetical protein